MTKEGDTGLTWEHRLALWLPGPLLFGAFLVAVCLSAAYLSFQWFFDLHVERSAFGIVLFITWGLIAPRYLIAPLDRQQNGLEVPLSERHKTEIRDLQLPRDAIRVSRFTGAAGVLAFFGIIELLLVLQGFDLITPWIQLHDGSATFALALLSGWFVRFLYFSFAGFYSPPSPQRSDIDLLNLENIYAFGRSGLRGTLVWFIILAISGLLILPGLGSGLWAILPLFAISLGVGLFGLLLPAREVRSLIRAVKREELVRLEPLLHQARDNALTGDVSTQGRLTDLLAYRTQVESTSEWPFDSSTLLRFGLYVFIPVASMIGGALVERVVGMVLD
ncbi:MAG: hypothetical protein O6945_13280 [Gammaproteobacteria bacterium]|nr:hypothetical protein [Gammaproteobacteria bacterium]